MMFTTTICFLLVLSFTTANQDKFEQLLEQVSSEVAAEMAQTAKAEEGSNITQLELNNKLLSVEASVLLKMQTQIEQLARLNISQPSDIAKELALKIQQNPALKSVLAKKGKKAPRFIGSLAVGLIRVANEVVNLLLIPSY